MFVATKPFLQTATVRATTAAVVVCIVLLNAIAVPTAAQDHLKAVATFPDVDFDFWLGASGSSPAASQFASNAATALADGSAALDTADFVIVSVSTNENRTAAYVTFYFSNTAKTDAARAFLAAPPLGDFCVLASEDPTYTLCSSGNHTTEGSSPMSDAAEDNGQGSGVAAFFKGTTGIVVVACGGVVLAIVAVLFLLSKSQRNKGGFSDTSSSLSGLSSRTALSSALVSMSGTPSVVAKSHFPSDALIEIERTCSTDSLSYASNTPGGPNSAQSQKKSQSNKFWKKLGKGRSKATSGCDTIAEGDGDIELTSLHSSPDSDASTALSGGKTFLKVKYDYADYTDIASEPKPGQQQQQQTSLSAAEEEKQMRKSQALFESLSPAELEECKLRYRDDAIRRSVVGHQVGQLPKLPPLPTTRKRASRGDVRSQFVPQEALPQKSSSTLTKNATSSSLGDGKSLSQKLLEQEKATLPVYQTRSMLRKKKYVLEPARKEPTGTASGPSSLSRQPPPPPPPPRGSPPLSFRTQASSACNSENGSNRVHAGSGDDGRPTLGERRPSLPPPMYSENLQSPHYRSMKRLELALAPALDDTTPLSVLENRKVMGELEEELRKESEGGHSDQDLASYDNADCVLSEDVNAKRGIIKRLKNKATKQKNGKQKRGSESLPSHPFEISSRRASRQQLLGGHARSNGSDDDDDDDDGMPSSPSTRAVRFQSPTPSVESSVPDPDEHQPKNLFAPENEVYFGKHRLNPRAQKYLANYHTESQLLQLSEMTGQGVPDKGGERGLERPRMRTRGYVTSYDELGRYSVSMLSDGTSISSFNTLADVSCDDGQGLNGSDGDDISMSNILSGLAREKKKQVDKVRRQRQLDHSRRRPHKKW